MLIDEQKENKLRVLKRMKEQNMLLIQNQFSSGMCPREAGRFFLIKGTMKKEEYHSCRHHSQGRNWVKLVLAFSAMRSNCTLSLYLTYSAACFQLISTFTKAKARPEIIGQTQGHFLPRFHTTP